MSKRGSLKHVDDAHSLARYVSPNKLKRDEEGNVIGVLFVAFALREGERYLSSSCIEAAGRPEDAGLAVLKQRYATQMTRMTNSGFALGLTEDIRAACATRSRVRIAIEPKKWNDAYVAIRQFPGEHLDVLELLASDAWGRVKLMKDI
jgi:hypothetical protein